MPTYEYACNACGLRFERRQAMTEPPMEICPECGGRVRRLISGGAGFIVKKSGAGGSTGRSGLCSLERSGATCCGRASRCEKPPCGGSSHGE